MRIARAETSIMGGVGIIVDTGRGTGRGRAAGRSLVRAAILLTAAAWLAAPGSAPAHAQVSVRPDILYAEPGGVPVFLDAYLPDGDGPFPGVLVIDGARWRVGDRKRLVGPSTMLAEGGIVAFAIDYRLAPQHTYPAAIEDAQAAVRWVRDHAQEFGVDPSQLGALGPSAGGHLSALLATMGEGPLEAGARIRAAVSWSGPMDLALTAEDGDEGVQNSIGDFLGCDLSECDDLLREASPITHLDPTDAPLFLANSTDEVIPLRQAEVMDTALGDAGVPHMFVEVPGDDHGTGLDEESAPGLPEGQTIGQASVEWFLRYLPQGASPPESPTGDGSTPPDSGPSTEPSGGRATGGRAGGEDGDSHPDWLIPVLAGGGVLLLVLAGWSAAAGRARRNGPPDGSA